jgi:hypothetical protein
MKHLYPTGTTAWVLLFNEPKFAVVIDNTEWDTSGGQELPAYGVRIVDQNADPVEVMMGGEPASVELHGIKEYRLHKSKLGAVRELVQRYAETHHWLELAIRDCHRNWDNAEVILERLKKFDKLREEEGA